MKKLSTRSLILGSALALAVTGTAYAGPDHTVPGTPGTPGCRGQTVAYIAQAAKNGIIPAEFKGFAGASESQGLTVKQFQEIATAYCNQ